MLTGLKENTSTENCFKYFPYFNHKLYENPSDFQEEEEYSTKSDSDSQNLEDSSTNISHDSINSIDDEEKLIPPNLLELSPYKTTPSLPEIQFPTPVRLFGSDINHMKNEEKSNISEILPDLQKYKLPKSLFCTSKIKQNEKEEKITFKNNISESLIDKKLDLSSKPYIPKYKAYPVVICNNSSGLFPNYAGKKFGQFPMNYLNYYKCSNNFEQKKKKKKVEFIEREGDWSCYRCKNINFSFRDKCNKCKFSKEESEKKFEEVGEALLKLADSSIYDKKCIDESK